MKCPTCLGMLEEVTIGRTDPITIDQCAMCEGIWFDQGELGKVINKEIRAMVEYELSSAANRDKEFMGVLDLKPIACLRCEREMVKEPSPRSKKTIMDYCLGCGSIWLDGGEYAAVAKRSSLETVGENFLDFFRSKFPHLLKSEARGQ